MNKNETVWSTPEPPKDFRYKKFANGSLKLLVDRNSEEYEQGFEDGYKAAIKDIERNGYQEHFDF